MPYDPTKFREPSRDDLIHAISHAMLFRHGTKRAHDWESINARVAAERLIEGLEAKNYVILQGPPGRSKAQADGELERAKSRLTD